MMRTRTGGAAVLVAADGERRSAMPPVPRLADHNTSWRTSRFLIRRIVRWRQTNRGSRCIKIKQLRVHTRPVLELCSHCMLMIGPVIGQPNMPSIRQCNFLGCDVNTRQLWNRNCGPGSLACIVGSRSHRSTGLMAMISKTSFTVTREMPGPTTNGWSAMTEAEVGGTLAMASWDDLPRELAVLAVN